jgi:hypothetical protein
VDTSALIAFDGKTLAALAPHTGLAIVRSKGCFVNTVTRETMGATKPRRATDIALASYGTMRILVAVREWLCLPRADWLPQQPPTFDRSTESYAGVFVHAGCAFTILPSGEGHKLTSRLVVSDMLEAPTIWRFAPELHADPLPIGLDAPLALESVRGCLPEYRGSVLSVDVSDIFHGFIDG